MGSGIFVTGTDTGVGKTLVAEALVRGLVLDGHRVAVMKPVAAGVDAGAGVNADVAALVGASNVDAPLGEVNPYSFAESIAPHLAARNAGVAIDPGRCRDAYQRLAACSDIVVVEGAGGALVPLGPRFDMLDLARGFGVPVLLVVGVRLGCINHALLSALAIRARGLRLAGWVANRVDPAMREADANIATLQAELAAPRVAECAHAGAGRLPPIRGAAGLLGLG
jgi:dethiobiotin synthetase